MEFNEIWTKEINDQLRQMNKEHKSYKEIIEFFGEDVIKHHPTNKFNYGSGGKMSYLLSLPLLKDANILQKPMFILNIGMPNEYNKNNTLGCFFYLKDNLEDKSIISEDNYKYEYNLIHIIKNGIESYNFKYSNYEDVDYNLSSKFMTIFVESFLDLYKYNKYNIPLSIDKKDIRKDIINNIFPDFIETEIIDENNEYTYYYNKKGE